MYTLTAVETAPLVYDFGLILILSFYGLQEDGEMQQEENKTVKVRTPLWNGKTST